MTPEEHAPARTVNGELRQTITVRLLPSGYVFVAGEGPCNWAQPPCWPCDEETLRAHTFSEASPGFVWSVLDAMPTGGES